jgi:hypothetical protein
MTEPNDRERRRLPVLRWACIALLVLLAALAGDAALHAARGNNHLWSKLRDFTAAFGGIIGVGLLLVAGIGLLFLIDALFFRDEPPRSSDRDAG